MVSVKQRLDSFIKSLEKDVDQHDYDILFGNKRKKCHSIDKSGGPSSSSKLRRILFETISSDIESEVIDDYFSGVPGDECRVGDNLDETKDHRVIATQVDLEEKKRQNEEAQQIAQWIEYCRRQVEDGVTMNKNKLIELLQLPEKIFESVISGTNMSPDALKKIVVEACELKTDQDGSLQNKLGILAQYGLLPKICEPNVPFRVVFPIYQKLVAATSSLIMLNRVLLPMFKTSIAIPRPFYGTVDKEQFFNLAITWLDEEHMELTAALASTLNHLLDGLKFIDDEEHGTIATLLERSVRYRPDDEDVGHFFWLIVSKFGETMSEVNLKRLQTLNFANETKVKKRIEAAIEKQLHEFA